MYVERLLQINVATLTALATLMVGAGQHNAMMPLGMMAAAMLSVWLTDVTGWFAIGRAAAWVASLGALAASVPWSHWDKMSLAVAVADFLVYVQLIHLFQRKTPRIYGALIRFSVLQVVVAALLAQAAFFGLVLVVYLFAALSALALLFLHSERLLHPGTTIPSEKGTGAVCLTGPQPDLHKGRLSPFSAVARGGPRWPLAGQTAEFASPVPGRSAVQGEFFRRVLRIAAATLLLSIPVFFAVPRIGRGVWRGFGFRPLVTVGYSDQMRLGHLGTALQNPEEVLRLRLYDGNSKEPYQVRGEVYLRGSAVIEYGKGEWSNPSPWRPHRDLLVEPLPSMGRPLVRQRIRVEPMYWDDLFCVWPFAAADADRRLEFNRRTDRLKRKTEFVADRMEFELLTTAFTNREQDPLIPNVEHLGKTELRELLQMPEADRRREEEQKGKRGEGETGRGAKVAGSFSPSSSVPNSPSPARQSAVPRLIELAAGWLAAAPNAVENRYVQSRLLESRLRDSGLFTYSLQGQSRDSAIDPIEDFIVNNPRGHCEFFATALALMLRSQQIPARVVIGYRTGEWIDSAGFFQVRQLHAHSWVEAYLRPEDLPPALARNPAWAWGAWLRLDPTPAADDDGSGSWRHALTNALGWLDFLWGHYVVDLDVKRQREAIYSPLADALRQVGSTLTSLTWWRDRLGDLWRTVFGDGGRGTADGAGMLAVATLLAVLIVVAVYFLYRVAGGAWRVAGAWGFGARNGRRPRARVEFYRRLEAVLLRWGLVRSPSQTQREFAAWAGRELAERTGDQRLALLPVEVAEAFYRVRFGGVALDTTPREAVEESLRRLELAVRRKKKQ